MTGCSSTPPAFTIAGEPNGEYAERCIPLDSQNSRSFACCHTG
uniref:Uncharacterized protein n=1 Tax=Arundo donax TaxID=35708 RepID=A0A0A9C0U3_ARUDO